MTCKEKSEVVICNCFFQLFQVNKAAIRPRIITQSQLDQCCTLNLDRIGKFTIHIDEDDLSRKAIWNVMSNDATQDISQSQPMNEFHTTPDRCPTIASPCRSPL
jgi:hypothetical protein